MDWSPHIVVKAEDVQSVPTSVTALKTFRTGFPDTKATVHCIGEKERGRCVSDVSSIHALILFFGERLVKSEFFFSLNPSVLQGESSIKISAHKV